MAVHIVPVGVQAERIVCKPATLPLLLSGQRNRAFNKERAFSLPQIILYFRFFRKINSSIVLIYAFFLNGSSPANLQLHLQELRCSLFSGLHFCRFRGIFLIYAV